MRAQLIKIGLASISLLFFIASASASPVEWSTAAGGNGHFYEFVADSSISWTNSLSSSASKGGYLATITSLQESDFILQLALNSFTPSYLSFFWLGGSDATTEGEWKWMDGPESGQDFVYTNFAPGEPNNYVTGQNSEGEDYLVMLAWGAEQYPSYHGKWNDFPGSLIWEWYQKGYVVEYNTYDGANPVPEPSTALLLGIGLAGTALAGRRMRRAQM